MSPRPEEPDRREASARGEGRPRPRVLTHHDALAAAKRAFVRDHTIDMASLARGLSVSRATLYRVVGSRDRIIGDVIASFGDATLRLAASETRTTGVERIIGIAQRFNAYTVGFEPLRAFTKAEPSTAARVLFTEEGGVHRRSVLAWKELLEEADATGQLTLPFEAEMVAFICVRIGESILYSNLLLGRETDVDLAAVILLAILSLR